MAQIPTGTSHIDIERDNPFRSAQPAGFARSPYASRSPTVDATDLAMPDYVAHREGATEIGKLSAEARASRI